MTEIAVGFMLFYALWIFYLAVMSLKRAKDEGRLSRVAHVFGVPVLFIGYALDFAVNVAVMTVIMLDIPQETTVTARLKRYVYGKDGWRRRFALWFSDNMLDDFDPSGKHV